MGYWLDVDCLETRGYLGRDPASLTIQPKHLGDAQVGTAAAVNAWKLLFQDPLCAKVVAESSPPIKGHRIVGFGASVLVSTEFADAETANPRPDINSRVIASIHSGHPVLATRKEVALANAGQGVDVLVLIGNWQDQLLSASERLEIQAGSISNFAEVHAGYQFRRIIMESARQTEKAVPAEFRGRRDSCGVSRSGTSYSCDDARVGKSRIFLARQHSFRLS